MDFNIFTTSNSSKNLADTFSNTSKVNMITEKLCKKRRTLEGLIKNSNDANRDTLALELLEIQNDMRTFTISESDYQIYPVKQKDTSD